MRILGTRRRNPALEDIASASSTANSVPSMKLEKYASKNGSEGPSPGFAGRMTGSHSESPARSCSKTSNRWGSYGRPRTRAIAVAVSRTASRVPRSAPINASSRSNSPLAPSAGAITRASSRIRCNAEAPLVRSSVSSFSSISRAERVRAIAPPRDREGRMFSRNARAVEHSCKPPMK